MKLFPLTFAPFNALGAALLTFILTGAIALEAQNTSPLDTAPGGATSAPAASDSASGSTTDNLVSNGDFSMATADPNWPDNWGKAKGITWEAEDGKHFLRLVAQEPGKVLMAYREIKLPAGTTNLEITIRFRTNNIATGEQNWMDARAIFHFLDSNRKPVTPDPQLMDFPKSTADWTVVSEKVTVPDGVTTLVLMPSLLKVETGTLDLAEIRVVPTSS